MSEFEVVFLGTGVSTAIPSIRHILDMNEEEEHDKKGEAKKSKKNICRVCQHASTIPGSKNKRNNVSIAIVYRDNHNHRKCVLIDAGKTLRDTCLLQLAKHKIKEVNGLLITHGHADAILGLDDLRDLQFFEAVRVPKKEDPKDSVVGFRTVSGPMSIYLTETTFSTVNGCFPYLTTCPPCYLDEKNNVLERRVAFLKFNLIDENTSFVVEDLPIRAFPVYHGGTYVSLGFSIGNKAEFVYISDVKIIPEDTWTYLKSIPKIKVLVIDALDRGGIFSHMSLDEAIEAAQILDPEFVYFTGVSCGMGLHDDVEAELQQRFGGRYHLAYDGLCLDGFSRE